MDGEGLYADPAHWGERRRWDGTRWVGAPEPGAAPTLVSESPEAYGRRGAASEHNGKYNVPCSWCRDNTSNGGSAHPQVHVIANGFACCIDVRVAPLVAGLAQLGMPVISACEDWLCWMPEPPRPRVAWVMVPPSFASRLSEIAGMSVTLEGNLNIDLEHLDRVTARVVAAAYGQVSDPSPG